MLFVVLLAVRICKITQALTDLSEWLWRLWYQVNHLCPDTRVSDIRYTHDEGRRGRFGGEGAPASDRLFLPRPCLGVLASRSTPILLPPLASYRSRLSHSTCSRFRSLLVCPIYQATLSEALIASNVHVSVTRDKPTRLRLQLST